MLVSSLERGISHGACLTGYSVAVKTVTSYFFFNDTATTEIYTLSLHDALPIRRKRDQDVAESAHAEPERAIAHVRSEEHTSELQSRVDLVCRLLLEKKKKK